MKGVWREEIFPMLDKVTRAGKITKPVGMRKKSKMFENVLQVA